MKKLPDIDLAELAADKERNAMQRRDFVKKYAEWVLKTPNKVLVEAAEQALKPLVRILAPIPCS